MNSPNGEVWKWMGKHWAYVGENAFSKDFNKNVQSVRKDISVTEHGGGLCVKKECGTCIGEECLLGLCENHGHGEGELVDVYTKCMTDENDTFEDLSKGVSDGMKEIKKTLGDMKRVDDDLLRRRTERTESKTDEGKRDSAETGSSKFSPSLKQETGQVSGLYYVPRLPIGEEKREDTMEKALQFAVGAIGKNGGSGLWQKPLFQGEK